jgi:signal peptidase II
VRSGQGDFDGASSVGELTRENKGARPTTGRAFLSRLSETELPGLCAHIIFWSIVIFGVALDLWTKRAVFGWLEQQPDQRYPVIDGFVELVMALNNGAAFNLFSGHPNWLIAVSAAALGVIVIIFFFSGDQHRLLHVALGFFTAGVCGNLYDRIFNDGLVRDFIDVRYWPGRHWPAFNVADSMLCTAVGLLILSSFLTEKPSRKHDRQRKAEHSSPHQGR